MSDGRARILVVDDERSMQEFLEIFLRREGYDVLTAGDVDTAIAHLDSDEVDLVITDMQMPEKTGLDLILEAREVSPETIASLEKRVVGTPCANPHRFQGTLFGPRRSTEPSTSAGCRHRRDRRTCRDGRSPDRRNPPGSALPLPRRRCLIWSGSASLGPSLLQRRSVPKLALSCAIRLREWVGNGVRNAA